MSFSDRSPPYFVSRPCLVAQPCFVALSPAGHSASSPFLGAALTQLNPYSAHHGLRNQNQSTHNNPRRWRRSRIPVHMQAKFRKQKDTQSSERPEDEKPSLDSILPPPILPTLTTLTNSTSSTDTAPPTSDQADLVSSISSTDPTAESQTDPDDQSILPKDPALAQMGAGLSQKQENAIVAFLRETAEEFKIIEWTPFGRIVRLTILVIVIIAVSTAALYVVDGFLSRSAKYLFRDIF